MGAICRAAAVALLITWCLSCGTTGTSKTPQKPAKPAAKAVKSTPKTAKQTPKPGKKPESKPEKKPTPKPVRLPKLLDLGVGQCLPCQMMKPVLDTLKKEYKGKLEVAYIDIREKPDAMKQYKVDMIPTQIFYDANGKELSRHIGYFSKQEVLDRFKEHKIILKR